MLLVDKAKEVLRILDDGGFYNLNGKWVDIKEKIEHSVENTRLYRPEQFELLTKPLRGSEVPSLIEVTSETTQIAAQRLVNEGCENLVLLNFASAMHPGGGFISGAKAQEEDLARCSALYSCLKAQTEYYQVNRKYTSMLYTDHVIYSPKVPWFRTRSRDEPSNVFLASVITAPAPNANKATQSGDSLENIQKALHRRCGQVLGVARDNGHRNILLGAWGCGVFGNDPSFVAKTFKDWLTTPSFHSSFDRIVFAVYDRSKGKATYSAFKNEFQ